MNCPRIVVVGAVAVDVKAHSFGDLVRRGDVPGRVRVSVGGVARNMAKNLALMGARVHLISAIGDDEFEWIVKNDLLSANVDISDLMIVCGQRTATWVGVMDAHGDLDVGVFGGEILDTLTPDTIARRADCFECADLVAVDATLPRAIIDEVVRQAKPRWVYLNPASVACARTVADGVGQFAVVTANALEAEVLTGKSIQTIDDATCAAQTLIERGVQHAIVTLGANGLVYADAREMRHVAAYPARVVDTTGAGDALAAMFLLGHLQGRPLDEILSRALQAAAITVACEESVSEEVRFILRE